MKIISLIEVPKNKVEMTGAIGASKQIPLSKNDGAPVYSYRVFTLEPGDIILTGTPEGVGKLNSGDHLHASISEIGTMEFQVK